MTDETLLPISRIYEIFGRHRESKVALARDLSVSSAYITQVLTGKRKDPRVLAAANRDALKYLRDEKRERERKTRQLRKMNGRATRSRGTDDHHRDVGGGGEDKLDCSSEVA